MKKLFYCIALAVCCAACSEDPVSTPSWTNNPGTTTVVPTADFQIKVQQPLTVVLIDKSENANYYRWDFGDGNTSTQKNPTHKYKGIGVYKVTLTVTSRTGNKSSISKNVTVEAPTKCYFAGVTYKKLSVNNKYIKFKLLDDDVFTTTWVNSVYELISTANLPYQFTLASPKLMNGLADDDWYVINVYYSNSNSGNGTKLAGFKFYTSQLLSEYPTELNWQAVDGNQISCQFIWK